MIPIDTASFPGLLEAVVTAVSILGGAMAYVVAVIRFLFSFPWGMLAAGTTVAISTGIAVFAFGAPPIVLIPVGWASATAYRVLNARFERQFNRR